MTKRIFISIDPAYGPDHSVRSWVHAGKLIAYEIDRLGLTLTPLTEAPGEPDGILLGLQGRVATWDYRWNRGGADDDAVSFRDWP